MADFLRLAGDAVKKRETAIQANQNYFLLNEAQCRRLWQNLRAVYCAFAPSLSYSLPVQQKCLPLHKEVYNIVLRADAIAEKCSDKQSWLKEAVFLGGNRQVFQELSADLQFCVNLFHYLTKTLCRDSQIPGPSNLINVTISEAVLDEDLQKDVTSLMSRLEEKQIDFGEPEKRLANYIAERDIFVPDPEPEPEPEQEPDTLKPIKRKKLPFYEVHREDPVHVENLGGGASGVVSKVKWLGLICAKKEFPNVESTAGFVKEVSALVALHHSRTVKLLCSNRKMPNPYFIMELMPMTLEALCKREDTSDNMRFEILPSINMMLQISSGMEYLHENGVVHRDLKSANILVSRADHLELRSEGYADIKLTDFGLAKMKVSDDSMVATCRMGTTQWSAPEVLGIPGSPLHRIDWRKVDMYSFAIVCSEILTGRRPYNGMSVGKVVDGVSLGQLRPNLPQDCPVYLSQFLHKCWAQNPKDRPTFKEITQTLSSYKTCLLICTVPEQSPVMVPRFKNFWIFGRVLKNEASARAQVFCPDPEEKNLVEAAVEYTYGRMKIMEALCSRMKKHLKTVQICHVQCDHLVKKYLEGFLKVKAVHNLVSPLGFWNLYQSKKLQQFSDSMDRLICSTMAVEELLRACGGSNWMVTALIIFAALPQARAYCSIFGMHLWNLYWNLFVVNHVMHDITAHHSGTNLRFLSTSSTLRVQWCEERCKLVLQKLTSSGHEDGEAEFLQADADRQAEDRKNLIMNLSLINYSPVSLFAQICTCSFTPEEPIEIGRALFLKNKLQSTSDPLDFDSYKFDDLKLENGEFIGRGSLKEVVRQKWGGEMVAVGTMHMTGRTDTGFMHEILMLAKLQHPNVVHFMGWKLDANIRCGYIMMDFMEQDLSRLIERNTRLYSRSPFSLLVTIDILLQVVEAMIHIHKCGVIYRDLKPNNILVSPEYSTKSIAQDLDVYYTVKLTDFQTAELWNSSSKNYTVDCGREAFEMPPSSECVFTTKRVGTAGYVAPEVWDMDIGEGYTFSVDVYSFGMTVYEIATGSSPFQSIPRQERNRCAIRGERPLIPNACAQGLKELIEKCWSGVPKDRPSFEQIQKDLWTLKYHEEIQP